METMTKRLLSHNWHPTTEQLLEQGYALVENVLSKNECASLIADYNADNTYRKTIVMERYRFGKGEYKYFQYPLPAIITSIRETVYPFIAPVANKWMEVLNIDKKFPGTHAELKQHCHDHG
jgi:hypothetical protein